jgi:hypothetical protein
VRCRAPWKCHPQGLATLSVVSSLPQPLRASFSSRRSWGSLFRAFLRFRDGKKSFLPFLPFLLFPAKPTRLDAGAPTACTHRSSRAPSCFPDGLGQGGACCSLERYDLSGTPSVNTRLGASLSKSPLSLFPPNDLTAARSRSPRGLRHSQPGVSLRKGRRPVWPFSPTAVRYLLGREPKCGLFFRLRGPGSLTKNQASVLAFDSLPPNGR